MGIGRASFSLVTAGRGKGGRGRKGQGVKEGSDRMAALKADQRCLDRASWGQGGGRAAGGSGDVCACAHAQCGDVVRGL